MLSRRKFLLGVGGVTTSYRLARDLGEGFVSPEAVITHLPEGCFPFCTRVAFGMLNVAASARSSVMHYDLTDTTRLIGETMVALQPAGAPQANNLCGLDATDTELVTNDQIDGSVRFINPSTMTVTARVPSPFGANLDCRDVVYADGFVYAVYGGSTGGIAKIDPASHTVVATLPLPYPRHAAYDGERYLWATTYDNGQVAKIDLSTFPAPESWVGTYWADNPATGSSYPLGIDVCGGFVVVFNNGGNGGGGVASITLIDRDLPPSNAVTTYPMPPRCAGHFGRTYKGKIYFSCANGGCAGVFDIASRQYVKMVQTGPNAIGIDILPNDRWLVVCGNSATFEVRPTGLLS